MSGNGDGDSSVATLVRVCVALLTPLCVVPNALTLTALRRHAKLRTPSSLLVASLAASDLGLGVAAPAAILLDGVACWAPLAGAATLAAASLLATAGVAADRFTSLAHPLHYNNIVTRASASRGVAALWVVATLLAAAPAVATLAGVGVGVGVATGETPAQCAWSASVARSPWSALCLCAACFAPAAAALAACYAYVFVIARRHACALRAETSRAPLAAHARYACTLAATVGIFAVAWLPVVSLMSWDAVFGTRHLHGWLGAAAGLPVLVGSACNPWIYAFRNTELSGCALRVLGSLCGCADSARAAREELAAHTSCASHLQLCAVSTARTTLLLLPAPKSGNAAEPTATSHRDTVVRLAAA